MVGSHRTDEDNNPSNPVKACNSSLVIAVRETNSWSNSWMVRFGGLDRCVAASAEGRAGRSQRDHALSPLQHRGPVFSRARAVAGVCGVFWHSAGHGLLRPTATVSGPDRPGLSGLPDSPLRGLLATTDAGTQHYVFYVFVSEQWPNVRSLDQNIETQLCRSKPTRIAIFS